jgi:hypothetical protein
MVSISTTSSRAIGPPAGAQPVEPAIASIPTTIHETAMEATVHHDA